MKNIETILTDAGIELTEEQKQAVTGAVAENYKTIAEFTKQAKKIETAEAERDAAKQQLEDANKTLEGFKDVDVEKFKKDIEGYKKRAEEAEANALKEITKRDQRDWLRAKFDDLGVTSERVRKSLTEEIMGEDGLKWKDGVFLGFSDYVNAENEKDHFFQTEEEKALEEQQAEAKSKAPKFTEQNEGGKETAEKRYTVPKLW